MIIRLVIIAHDLVKILEVGNSHTFHLTKIIEINRDMKHVLGKFHGQYPYPFNSNVWNYLFIQEISC